MKYQLPWGAIPANARVGNSFEDKITLYRADKLERLKDARDVGILSTALALGDMEKIWEFGDMVRDPIQWSNVVLRMQGILAEEVVDLDALADK